MSKFSFITKSNCSLEHQIVPMSDGSLKHIFVVSDTDPLTEILNRTVDEGFMTADYKWKAGITKECIAVWVNMANGKLNTNRWTWAEERWNLKNLRQSFNKAINKSKFVSIEARFVNCFG